MAEGVHEVEDARGAHWIPPAGGEGGEMGEFICGDGGVGAEGVAREGEGGREVFGERAAEGHAC